MNHLDNVIAESAEHHRTFAILFIDLDHFKAVNDTYGHEYGDKLLVDATQRMQDCLRETDFVARLGGDEFIVLLEMISTAEKAMDIANELIQSISLPYKIKAKSLSIGASIGISLYPQHDSHAEGLLKKADDALYQAKDKRGKAILFNQS
jgi:diguanylate cyclase (GGDEF)-like protein